MCGVDGVDSLRGGLAEGNRISEPDFFDTLTIQNDQISHVNHVLAPLYVLFSLFGCWGGGGGGLPRGLRHNLLMQFSGLSSSKMEITSQVVRSKPGRRIYGENATYPPILAFLGLFAYPTPRG